MKHVASAVFHLDRMRNTLHNSTCTQTKSLKLDMAPEHVGQALKLDMAPEHIGQEYLQTPDQPLTTISDALLDFQHQGLAKDTLPTQHHSSDLRENRAEFVLVSCLH